MVMGDTETQPSQSNAARGHQLPSVVVVWHLDHDAGLLRLRWEERGGPPLTRAPERRGFGSRVIHASVQDQLHGKLAMDWEAEGLVCHISLPLMHVQAPEGSSGNEVSNSNLS